MRLTLLAGLAGLLTLSLAAFAVPASAAQPVKGAVQGTTTAAVGVGKGAVQAGRGVGRGAVTAARGVGRGAACVFTLGRRC